MSRKTSQRESQSAGLGGGGGVGGGAPPQPPRREQDRDEPRLEQERVPLERKEVLPHRDERQVRHPEPGEHRSEEHTSELQSHSFISYAVFSFKKKKKSHSRPTCSRTHLVPHTSSH